MGVLPLQFATGESAASLQLTGDEAFAITGLQAIVDKGEVGQRVTVKAGDKSFSAVVRIDTPNEFEYYRNGGILQFVLRQLAAKK